MLVCSPRSVRARSLAAVCCLALPASAQIGPFLPRALPPFKSFVFNKKFDASEGLRFQFTRQVPTVSPEGGRVAPNEPRYAPVTTIATAPSFEVIRQTEGYVANIASGFDHNGVTPILVTYETRVGLSHLDVFVGAGDELVRAEQTGVGRNRTTLAGDGDLLRGAHPGKRYLVTAAAVCHGLVVIFSTVTIFDPPTFSWRDSANAFITSQDQGRTWTLVYESATFQPGPPRGAAWTMQNWWPTKRNITPQEAFFAATDYCNNPGSPGGRFYLMRARRHSPGAPWTLEPGAIAMESQGHEGEHFHTGGVLPLPGGGIRAFLAIGDRRTNNRIVSLINRSGSYTGAWERNEAYHGSAAVEALNPGVEANQFVGCAPGPFENTILAGGDLTSEHIMLLTMDPESLHPRTQRLVGFPCLDMSYFTAFVIRTPSPERGGPYVANAEPFAFIPIPFSKRTLYSPDGIHWAQAAAPDGGYPILHGPHIYFDGSGGQGLSRTHVPDVVTARPLLVGPGGLQHSKAAPILNPGDPPQRITPLTRDAIGRWTDNGVPIDPQPPTFGAVYRVQTSASDASAWIGRIHPCGMIDPMNAVLGDHFQMRIWVRSMDPSRSGTLSIGIGDADNSPFIYRNWNVACTDSWIPVTAAEPVTLTPGSPFQLHVRCVGDICNDQTMYIALDAVQEGAGMPGYAMPADTSIPPRGSAFPDERASVTGLACSKSWTITLALQIPEDGFDFRADTQRRWPLATLWGDDHNLIELIADISTGCVEARITSRGVPSRALVSHPNTFIRGAPIFVSIAQPLGTSGIEMTSSVGSTQTTTSTIPSELISTVFLATPPREIRFFSPTIFPSSAGRGVATSPLLVWGGRIDERRALSRPEREQLFRSLSFLTTPP